MLTLTMVFASVACVNWSNKRVYTAVIVVAVIGLLLNWLAVIRLGDVAVSTRFLGSFFALGVTALLLLKSILTEFHASTDAVIGSICVYLIFGLMWALGYSGIEIVEPGAFEFPEHLASDADGHKERIADFSVFIYYSFVTMSSLGYGEITPRTDLARTLAWSQVVTGQFYLAILVARLISVLPRTIREPDDPDEV